MPYVIPLDPDDLAQERALARLERRDPEKAAADFVRRERRWYAHNCGLGSEGLEVATRLSQPRTRRPKPHRTPESIERRRQASREWWRTHGAEYRRQRKGQGGPRRDERP